VFSAEGSDVSVELNSYRPKSVEKSVEKIVEKTTDRILAQFARDAQIINLHLQKYYASAEEESNKMERVSL
jgi:hypothetical protein